MEQMSAQKIREQVDKLGLKDGQEISTEIEDKLLDISKSSKRVNGVSRNTIVSRVSTIKAFLERKGIVWDYVHPDLEEYKADKAELSANKPVFVIKETLINLLDSWATVVVPTPEKFKTIHKGLVTDERLLLFNEQIRASVVIMIAYLLYQSGLRSGEFVNVNEDGLYKGLKKRDETYLTVCPLDITLSEWVDKYKKVSDLFENEKTFYIFIKNNFIKSVELSPHKMRYVYAYVFSNRNTKEGCNPVYQVQKALNHSSVSASVIYTSKPEEKHPQGEAFARAVADVSEPSFEVTKDARMIHCYCGSSVTSKGYLRHTRTKKHQEYIRLSK